jgi:hypothetical protein
MAKAAIASVQLARFDRLREAGPVRDGRAPGTVFCNVAADTRAAGTEPASQQAFTFLILALHEDAASAQRFLADRVAWMDEAQEVWGGILEPFRHHGAANYLDRADPGHLFESMMPADLADGPVVALTTSGWSVGESLDMNRVREFGAGVLAVRASMTGVPGLRSQQSFFFPGVIEYDPITVTFWCDEASIRALAYGQGSHRRQLDRHRTNRMGAKVSVPATRILTPRQHRLTAKVSDFRERAVCRRAIRACDPFRGRIHVPSALRATRRCAELNSPCWDDSPYCFLNCQGSLQSDTAADPLVVHRHRDNGVGSPMCLRVARAAPPGDAI